MPKERRMVPVISCVACHSRASELRNVQKKPTKLKMCVKCLKAIGEGKRITVPGGKWEFYSHDGKILVDEVEVPSDAVIENTNEEEVKND